MIVDLDQAGPVAERRCDLCIVGSGAAGLALASDLENSGLSVIVCEAGGLDHEPATQALYDADVTGLPFAGVHEGRFRVHGGSTTRWGGQALPLMPLDFERRDWVPHSGWPIDFASLAPFYRRATDFLGVDSMDFEDELYRHLRRERAAFDPDAVRHHFSKWSPTPDLRRRHTPRLRESAGVTLLLHANLTDLALRPGLDSVESATFRSLGGGKVVVRARAFALCVGGIETARVLLSNRRQIPAGIGNKTGLVGRFFQDHPAARVGSLRPRDERRFQRMFNVSAKGGRRYSTRVTLGPAAQRSLRSLNASALLNFDVAADSGMSRLKNAYANLRRHRRPGAALGDLWAAARRPGESLYPLWRFAAFGEVYAPAAAYGLTVMCEQEPSPDSRVGLSPNADALGVPKASVRWQLTDLVGHTLRSFATLLAGEFRRTDLAEVDLADWVGDESADWRAEVVDQNHHIGTARMADSPREGVVDADLRVHGIDNLYVASSAVFPTGGHSNPTLTILALTFRLADELRGRLGERGPAGLPISQTSTDGGTSSFKDAAVPTSR